MLPVTKIQHFSTKDGPGIRTTVFLKDCPLHCVWCHNPETQSSAPPFFYADALCICCGGCAAVCSRGIHRVFKSGHSIGHSLIDRDACARCMKCTEVCPTGALEVCFRELSEEAILNEVMKDRAFYGSLGGVTLSGGEPTLHREGAVRLLGLLRNNGIHTAMETCGYFSPSILPALTAVTNLFLWDVKDTDDERHRAGTGVSNRRIIENLRQADEMGAKTVMRCILIKTVNLEKAHLDNLCMLYRSLKHCQGVELLPYHTLGDSKNRQLGQKENGHKEWIPSAEDLRLAEEYLRRYVPVLQA